MAMLPQQLTLVACTPGKGISHLPVSVDLVCPMPPSTLAYSSFYPAGGLSGVDSQGSSPMIDGGLSASIFST